MKTCLLIILISLLADKTRGQTEILKETNLKFELPNNKWSLADKKENNDLAVYFYKREAIINKEGQAVTPTISFVIEPVKDPTDLMSYSIEKRISVPFTVTEVFSHDDKNPKIKLLNAVGYKGVYDAYGTSHTIYIVHYIHKTKGVQVICDITSELFPTYENEFLKTLLSLQEY